MNINGINTVVSFLYILVIDNQFRNLLDSRELNTLKSCARNCHANGYEKNIINGVSFLKATSLTAVGVYVFHE